MHSNQSLRDVSQAGLISGGEGFCFPAIIERSGRQASRRFVEFFTAHIRNLNTRQAYVRAAARFLTWCEERDLGLEQLEPVLIAAYVEGLGEQLAAPSVKQHLAAIRMLFDYLVVGQILPQNPASSVRGPKHVVSQGKTPVLYEDNARHLIASVDSGELAGLRDRAIIGVMTYSFARVGATTRMRVRDYYSQGRRAWFVLHEKGGRFNRVPAHHKAAEYVDAYLQAAGIAEDKAGPLFRAFEGRSRGLSDRSLRPAHVLRMVKRRARVAGLPAEICCHTFRATGITDYLANGGALETAAHIAGHASTRTTQLYNRTRDEISLDEIERIQI